MNQAKQALLVAEWEFWRYFKWKDQALGLMIFIVLPAIGYAASRLAVGERDPVTIATAGIELETLADGRVRFRRPNLRGS